MKKHAASAEKGELKRLDHRERELWAMAAFVTFSSLAFFLILVAPMRLQLDLFSGILGTDAEYLTDLLTVLLAVSWYYLFRSQRKLWNLRRRVWQAELEREVLRNNLALGHKLLCSNRSMFEAETDRAEIARVVTDVALAVFPIDQAAVFSYSDEQEQLLGVAEVGGGSFSAEGLRSYGRLVLHAEQPLRREEHGTRILAVRIGPAAAPAGALVLAGKRALHIIEAEPAQMLASNLALAWEMAALRASQQRQQTVLESVNAISLAVVSSTDLKSTLATVVEHTMAVLQAEAGSLLLGDERGQLEFVVARGPAANRLVGLRLPFGQGIVGQVFASGKAVRIDKARARLEFDRSVDELTSYSTESIIAAPLALPDERIGVIELLNRRDKRQFTDADLMLLRSIANQVALLIRHARLVDEEVRAKREWEITLDAIGESILVHDSNGVISRLNRPAARLFDSEPGRLLGTRVQQLLGFSHDGCVFCAASSAERPTEELKIGMRTFLISTAGIPSAQGSAFVHVLRDITERKRLEQELSAKEREKLAALGLLVAGVAHELNNPLMSILGYADLAEMEKDGERLRRDLRTIRKEAGRTCDIVRRLLDFAREEQIERRPVDLGLVLQDTLEGERLALERSGIDLKLEGPAQGPWVLGDRLKLQQVFVNLVQNARQELDCVPGQPRRLEIRMHQQDGQVYVRVADNGRGIPQEHRNQIFQPFFTTKPPGIGTGLGLAVSYGLVRSHLGEIRLDPQHAQGAAFEVILPESRGPEQTGTHLPTGRSGDPIRPQRILVVDDEEPIRDFVTRALQEAGHAVDTAGDATAALSLLGPNVYDLILCDWRMPGLPPGDLYRRITSCGATPRWIFVSGDSANPDLIEFAQREKLSVLYKPFGIAELMRLVTAALPGERTAESDVPLPSHHSYAGAGAVA